MPYEIKDQAQRDAIVRMHKYVKSNIDTRVSANHATAISFGENRYAVKGGERMWVDNSTNEVFYLTIEDQKVQLTFIVRNFDQEILVSKRNLYGDRGRTGARATRAVSYSSS